MRAVETWTGAEAKALRQAMRLSIREFAAHLDINWRTVTRWESRGESITPLPDSQALLDTALNRASEIVKRTFTQLLAEPRTSHESTPAAPTAPSAVAVPVVIDGQSTLVEVPDDVAATLLSGRGEKRVQDDTTAETEPEAMSPLSRRQFLQHGIATAAASELGRDPFPDSRTRTTSGTRLDSLPTAPGASWAAPIYDSVLGLPRGQPVPVADREPSDLRHLQNTVRGLAAAEVASDYTVLSRSLPPVIETLATTEPSPEVDESTVSRILSEVYTIAGWTLIKADSPLAAWVAVQKAIDLAEETADTIRLAAATRCLSEVHMRAKNFQNATHTAFLASVQLDTVPHTENRPIATALRGAALLSAAAAAARGGERREAHVALNAAHTCATELRTDRCDFGVAFGPTNVVIHRVAVAVELGEARAALQHAQAVALDNLPPGLTERRSRFLIDVARAHTALADNTSALAALRRAEGIAPSELREHRLTHELVTTLLTKEKRSTDLRALAERCHQLN